MSDLFLTHYNQDLDIIVASDASSYGIGVSILPKMTDGTTKLIARVESFASCGEKLFANWKKDFRDYVCSLKVSPFYSWTTLYATDWPQAITHHFGLKERPDYSHSQQTAEMGYYPA